MSLEEEVIALTLAKEEAGQLHRVNELEGQVVLLEDVVARKDAELKEVLQRLSSEEAAEKARQTSNYLGAQARENAERLREENTFLSNVIRRYEQKTMDLESQLDVLSRAKDEADANRKELKTSRAALADAQAAVADFREREILELERTRQLQEAIIEASEQVAEHRQAAESAALLLRAY